MSGAKHTRGPWRVLRRGNQTGTRSVLVVGRANQPICEPKNFDDADLIAAAPELLEALQAFVDEVEGTFPFESLKSARAAISKAIGAAQ